jgi:tetratricopeptide (TPR) repeat protein
MQPYKSGIRFILTFLMIIVSNTFCPAQWYNPEKVNKKAGEIYAVAYEDAQDQKYESAIANIKKALVIEPKFLDAYLSRAGIYANLKKYDSSVIDFEKAILLDSVYSKPYLLPYSISLAGLGQFQKALDAVIRFLQTEQLNSQSIRAGNYRKGTYEFAVAYEKQHPRNNYIFSPKNLGDSVNSTALEYFPSGGLLEMKIFMKPI